MSKLLKNMLMISSRVAIKSYIRKIVDKYLIYILSTNNYEENVLLFERINNALSSKLVFNEYRGQFDRYEYGHISKIYSDKGFGFISIKKNGYSFFFHASKTINDFARLKQGDFVRFIPSLVDGKWQAVSVESDSLEEAEIE